MSSVKVDVIDLIARAPVVGFQIGVLILCMLVAAIDGFDTQAIGYTAPAIAGVLKLPMAPPASRRPTRDPRGSVVGSITDCAK
jgi:hypothetical protein